MKILIADDHALFRDSLRSLLEARGLAVVGEACNGREAVELAERLQPDVVLMDLSMPEMDGLEATRRISAAQPQVKVVMLTASNEDANLFEAIQSGAQGYLLKNLESGEFFALLEGIDRGEPALTPGLARKLLQEFARARQPAPRTPEAPPPLLLDNPEALTDREQEILGLLVRGITSNRKLAHHLGVSENTVKFHIRNILEKLHVSSRTEVVSHAIRHRIVAPPLGGDGES